MKLIKVLLAFSVAGLAGLYGIQNLVNLESAHGFVALVFSQQGHDLYPASLIPPITAPTITWAVLFVIIGGELLAAVLALLGGVRMLTAPAGSEAFAKAKQTAMLGAGIGVLVWFGLFAVIGGAGIQMWQTPAGANALAGAFQDSVLCFLTLIFLAGRDD